MADAGAAAPGPSVATAARTLDGPDPDILGLSGLAVARDGSGGLVYLKQIAGVPRVFVSVLSNGVFQAPQQVDALLPGPSAQPVVAAGSGGLLIVAFIDNGSLFTVTKPADTAALGAPREQAGGAANPAVGVSVLDKAYVAFTAPGAGGHDVRAAYYDRGRWALEPTPLDDQPGDDAGTGSGRPAVAVSGDGVATVAWGESGHVFSRRVWGTHPSAVDEQADPPEYMGWQEVSADEPQVGSGGDSSYAVVGFHELISDGGLSQSRVLANRLRGSQYDGARAVDGLGTPGSGGADQPAVALGEFGSGFVTSVRVDDLQLFAAHVGANAAIGSTFRVDSLENRSPPYPVPAAAGLSATLIAWQQDPGTAGPAEIRVRYAPGGADLGAEEVLSSPDQGAADAAHGLYAAGDEGGDAAVAWVQEASGARSIMVAQMFQPPSGPAPLAGRRYVHTARPTLRWRARREGWGPLRYSVTVDGVAVGESSDTRLTLPVSLPDGWHTWQVIASNPAGQTSSMPPARFFVDTVAPSVLLRVTGSRRAGTPVQVAVHGSDPPPSSGIAFSTILWGDGDGTRITRRGNGDRTRITRQEQHRYLRPGRYTIRVIVVDRAGNRSVVIRLVQVMTTGPRRPPPATRHRGSSGGGGGIHR